MAENSKKIVVGVAKSMDVISWGKQKGKRRFKCKNCGTDAWRPPLTPSRTA